MVQVDGGEPEIEIQDSVGSEGYSRLDVSRAPVVVTLARYIVDIVNIFLTSLQQPPPVKKN